MHRWPLLVWRNDGDGEDDEGEDGRELRAEQRKKREDGPVASEKIASDESG